MTDKLEIPGFKGELLGFQVEDLTKLVKVTGGLNCNEMGLGKTVEAIALDMIYRQVDDGPTLIIAPLGTVDDAWSRWLNELTDLDFVIINNKNREKSWTDFTNRNADVFVTHWQSLLKMPELASYKWMHIIADEVQQIQNRKKFNKKKKIDEETGGEVEDRRPTTTYMLKQIKAPRKLAMSGTPLEKLPDRLWSVLNWLYPKQYTSYWRFYNKYVDSYSDHFGYRKERGPKNVDQLHAELEPFFVRHLKQDVIPDLPEKYYTVLTPPLTPPQQRQYKSMAKDMLAWVGENEDQLLTSAVPVSQFTRLHQIANATIELGADEDVRLIVPSNKINCLMEDILAVTTEQVIVFCQGTKMLHLVEERLDKDFVSYVKIDGSVSRTARQAAIDRFQGGGARVFLGTIQAAGVGITLTVASTVVFMDRTERTIYNDQAEDRAWRIGQKNAVQIIDIRSRGTVDHKRQARLVRKKEWFREILGDVG